LKYPLPHQFFGTPKVPYRKLSPYPGKPRPDDDDGLDNMCCLMINRISGKRGMIRIYSLHFFITYFDKKHPLSRAERELTGSREITHFRL